MGMFINGKRVSYSGGSVIVNNGTIIVDGKRVDVEDSPVINIVVEGDAGSISGDYAEITLKGQAESVNTASGDVTVYGDVRGNVSTMSGDVDVDGSIEGSVNTMSGNIRSRSK